MRSLHFGLRVSDLDRSLSWYTRVGYEVVGQVPETPFGAMVMLKLPHDAFVALELVHDTSTEAAQPTGLNHFVLQVESMHRTVAELASRGIDADPPRCPDGSGEFWLSWLTDPDGYRIELVQWPAGHAVGMTRTDFAET